MFNNSFYFFSLFFFFPCLKRIFLLRFFPVFFYKPTLCLLLPEKDGIFFLLLRFWNTNQHFTKEMFQYLSQVSVYQDGVNVIIFLKLNDINNINCFKKWNSQQHCSLLLGSTRLHRHISPTATITFTSLIYFFFHTIDNLVIHYYCNCSLLFMS